MYRPELKNQSILTCLLFSETSLFAYVVTKVATRHQVDDQVEVLAILKCILHVDQEWVIQLAKELLLIHDRVNAAF